MPCPELDHALSQWLESEESLFAFSADRDQVWLRRLVSGVLLGARLATPRADEALLEQALSLGQPSLARFPGALARDPADGQLWLLHRLEAGCACSDLLAALETLLNQRDTWQAMLAHTPSPAKARPLRLTPGLIGERSRYA